MARVAAFFGAVCLGVITADRGANEIAGRSIAMTSRQSFLGNWSKAIRALESLQGSHSVRAEPLVYVGNLSVLMEQLGRLPRTSDRSQPGFAAWLRRHGDDVERSSEERDKLALFDEPILNSRQQRQFGNGPSP